MSAAVFQRYRAASAPPSRTTRGISFGLAMLVSGLLLLMLSMPPAAFIKRVSRAPIVVELIPLPPEPPPLPPPAPVKAPLKLADTPSPAPSARPAPAPPERVDTTPAKIVIATVPPPLATPILADVSLKPGSANDSGTSVTGTGKGNGNGSGGDGSGAGGSTFVLADWEVVPGDRELGPYNPTRARRNKVSGSTILVCRVLHSGHVEHCRVLQETPKGYGFGKAGLRAAHGFRVKPPRHNGKIIENAWVGIPLRFINK